MTFQRDGIIPNWQDNAACRGQAAALFYPADRGNHPETRIARRLCADCPVRAECLEAGHRERYGIWGGLATRERRTARRRL